VLTDLFETLILQGEKLTLMNMLMLMLAAPITIVHKLANGGRAPFPSNVDYITGSALLPTDVRQPGKVARRRSRRGEDDGEGDGAFFGDDNGAGSYESESDGHGLGRAPRGTIPPNTRTYMDCNTPRGTWSVVQSQYCFVKTNGVEWTPTLWMETQALTQMAGGTIAGIATAGVSALKFVDPDLTDPSKALIVVFLRYIKFVGQMLTCPFAYTDPAVFETGLMVVKWIQWVWQCSSSLYLAMVGDEVLPESNAIVGGVGMLVNSVLTGLEVAAARKLTRPFKTVELYNIAMTMHVLMRTASVLSSLAMLMSPLTDTKHHPNLSKKQQMRAKIIKGLCYGLPGAAAFAALITYKLGHDRGLRLVDMGAMRITSKPETFRGLIGLPSRQPSGNATIVIMSPLLVTAYEFNKRNWTEVQGYRAPATSPVLNPAAGRRAATRSDGNAPTTSPTRIPVGSFSEQELACKLEWSGVEPALSMQATFADDAGAYCLREQHTWQSLLPPSFRDLVAPQCTLHTPAGGERPL